MRLTETIHYQRKNNQHSRESYSTKRNPIVELARFAFSIMIMFWHARGYNGGGTPSFCGKMGYIGVEFFFLVSGYLVAAKAWHQREQVYRGTDTLHFLGGKLKGLMPIYPIALIGGFVTTVILENISFRKAVKQLLLSLYDSSLLRISGISIVQFVGGSWYISAMLLGGIVLYSLQRKYKDVFSCLIAPVSALLLLGYLFNNYSKLDVITGGFKVFAPGFLRALAEMSIGCISFRAAEWLRRKRLTIIASTCFSLINIVCIGLVFVGATRVLHKRFDYIMLALLAICVTIMFSEQSLYFRFRKKTIDVLMIYLGSLSLPMYLTHIWIKSIVIANTNGWSRQKGLVLYFVCVLSFSMLCLWISRLWKTFLLQYGTKIKHIFVQE